MMNDTKSITPESFSELLGITIKDLPKSCVEFMGENDFEYRTISKEERDTLLLKAIKVVDSGQLSKSGKQKKDVWEKGWKKNYDEFIKKFERDKLNFEHIKIYIPFIIKSLFKLKIDKEFFYLKNI